MTERLASVAATVSALPASARERFGPRVAARHKLAGEWLQTTYSQAADAIDQLALGLIDAGIEPGDRVCILSETRIEWTLASYAISAAAAIAVPVYPTNSPSECEWVIGDSGARAIFCENRGQLEKIERVRGGLPELVHTIGIDPGGGELTLEELQARGRNRSADELRARQADVGPDDAYMIVYTSGTTGPPKGTVLSHANGMSVCTIVRELEFVTPDETIYLYLPLAHVFALITQLASWDQGTALVYYGGDTSQILPELIETKPTYLPSVPRIFEKLYAAATAMASQAGEQERLQRAIKLGVDVRRRRQHGEPVPEHLERAFEAADAEIFTRVRGLFGGRLRQAVSGAAPIAPDILEFFYAAGVPVLEGWGMTETTAVGTVGTLEHFKFGTVGRAVPGVELRIAERDHEILMRGPNVFSEYWRNPEATAETLVDGWLHTGDIGELDEHGYLTITGRKKEIIITAGGKNLAPANLENDIKQSRFVSQAVMYGDRRPYPVALITLDPDEIVPWARERGLPEEVAQLSHHAAVRELIQGELDRANSRYAQVEQIKKFAILDRDLSIANDELTPTLKVKRGVINQRYAELFASLYESG